MRNKILMFAVVVIAAFPGCPASPLGTTTPDSDLRLTCETPVTDIYIQRNRSHNACCCNESECTSYDKSTHICDTSSRKIKSLPAFSAQSPEKPWSAPSQTCLKGMVPSAYSKLGCCGDQIFRSDFMSCNSSTGELILVSPFLKFRSLRLCKTLPSTPKTKSPLRLLNKDVYIEGHVNDVLVDLSAHYLFIDLKPFNLTASSNLPVSCQPQGRRHMRVKIRLPVGEQCGTLGEVRKYMKSKTLCIWIDSHASRCGGHQVMTLSIPQESTHHWMMLSMPLSS